MEDIEQSNREFILKLAGKYGFNKDTIPFLDSIATQIAGKGNHYKNYRDLEIVCEIAKGYGDPKKALGILNEATGKYLVNKETRPDEVGSFQRLKLMDIMVGRFSTLKRLKSRVEDYLITKPANVTFIPDDVEIMKNPLPPITNMPPLERKESDKQYHGEGYH